MTKYLFLAAAMTVAAPVAAQSSQVPPQGTQQSGEIAAGADQSSATSSQSTAPQSSSQPESSSQPAGQPAPADSTVAAPTTDAQAAPATGQPAPSQPAPDPDVAATAGTGGTQVAQVVGQEFGSYDKDGDGKLSQTEFAGWMVALKTASDPATKADSPATKKWVGAAFAQADKDKSRSLTQAELTGFLSQGQS